jgi:hypothetical protein
MMVGQLVRGSGRLGELKFGVVEEVINDEIVLVRWQDFIHLSAEYVKDLLSVTI